MTGTFEFTGKGGTCRLEAKYECVMESEMLDADGWKIEGKAKPTTAGRCMLTAYVNGKRVDSCWDPSFWRLIDYHGVKKIWGLKVGFADSETAKRYEAWIADIIEKGTTDEVKAYRAAQEAAKAEAEYKAAAAVVEAAEKQEDIPSAAEAKRRMKWYNDTYNEGGDGYVPHIYSREEYDRAKAIIAKHNAEKA